MIAVSSTLSIGLAPRSAGMRRQFGQQRASIFGIGAASPAGFRPRRHPLQHRASNHNRSPCPAEHRAARLRARGGLRAWRSCRSRPRPTGDRAGFRRGWRTAALRWRHRCRLRCTFAPARSAASPASWTSAGKPGQPAARAPQCHRRRSCVRARAPGAVDQLVHHHECARSAVPRAASRSRKSPPHRSPRSASAHRYWRDN